MAICHTTLEGGPRRNWVLRPLSDAALIPFDFIGVARLSYKFSLPRAILGRTRLGLGDFAVTATAKTQAEVSTNRSVSNGRLPLRGSTSRGSTLFSCMFGRKACRFASFIVGHRRRNFCTCSSSGGSTSHGGTLLGCMFGSKA